jgi:hypothetical protein
MAKGGIFIGIPPPPPPSVLLKSNKSEKRIEYFHLVREDSYVYALLSLVTETMTIQLDRMERLLTICIDVLTARGKA